MGDEINWDGCPICHGVIGNWAIKNDFGISKCNLCNFAFVNPRPTIDYFNDYYSKQGHGELINSIEGVLQRERIYPNATVDAHRIISFLTENICKSEQCDSLTLLDVGSGFGFFSKEAMNQGFEVTSLEIAENEADIYTQLIGSNPSRSTFEIFESTYKYDVILMSQVLEHAVDVNLWISKAYQMLSPNGILVIALPNFNSFMRYFFKENDPLICPPDHLNFFNATNLTSLLKIHNFEVMHTEQISRIEKAIISNRCHVNGFLLDILETMVSKVGLNVFDCIGCGMMLNIYAKKPNNGD